MLICTDRDVDNFIQSRGIRVIERLNPYQTFELKLRVFRGIGLAMDEPHRFTGTVQNLRSESGYPIWTYLWDWLPLKGLPEVPYETINSLISRYNELFVLFETNQASGYRVEPGGDFEKHWDGTDLYLIPEKPDDWMIVATHEEQFGPYILSAP